MPDVVDLGSLKNNNNEPPEDLGGPALTKVKTALLLIQNEDGNWHATPDIAQAAQIEPEEVPDGNSMVAGLSVVLSDIQAEKTANLTAVFMQQLAMQQMSAMQNQQLAANLNLKH